MTGLASFRHSGLQGLERTRVLGSHVDKALASVTGKPGEGEPFEDTRRIPFHEQSVGEGSRVALVTVGNDETPAAVSFLRDGGPFLRSGEASPTATAQPRNLHLVTDSFRATSFQHR